MTENEAKEKWCPFSTVQTNGAVVNRDNPHDSLITDVFEATRCIGSDCMMWRWDELEDASRFHQAGGTVPDSDGLHTSWTVHRKIKPEERRGHCGFAGK